MNFSTKLLHWYKYNHRDLPWRNTQNPYLIWISEIILQQTRVNQGYQYYLRFIEKFPDVQTLAKAEEEDVLKLWQGLGYYSRARNIYYAAQQIISDFNGVFPSDYHDIIKLKGIGNYSASAIASFAFKQCYPVIDGNVLRVISRIYGISTPIDIDKGKKEVLSILKTLIDEQNPDIFNQAIMELGAMVCLPQNPKCETCPLNALCFATSNKIMHDFPVKTKKINQRSRFFYYLVIRLTYNNTEFVYLNKRTNNDIWKNMYDFPLIESEKEMDVAEDISFEIEKILKSNNYNLKKVSRMYRHQLTHQAISAYFFDIKITTPLAETTNFIMVPSSEINIYPIPKLVDNYLKDNCV
ncbi:MAG: A/G-specific adenine glycosylase [Bacteroidetes bacterium]|nr:A/G-specific adenine glycosylase [Bacteroidota bacterium]